MQKTSTVTVPFMLLGILFNICLVASNLLETKVIHILIVQLVNDFLHGVTGADDLRLDFVSDT